MRGRLIAALLVSIGEKGYAASTVADVVRNAHVSKRTFYEHFVDKDACFLAAYRAVSDGMLQTIAASVSEDGPWKEQLHTASRAYLRALEENAPLTRAFMLEIHVAGPAALAERRAVHQRFAELLIALSKLAKKKHPELRALTPAMATALVGGINELVLVALEKGDPVKLRDLATTATELAAAVLCHRPLPGANARSNTVAMP